MSVSDQLFVSHFPIPQGLRVMISQILLTCLSSRIGRTHYLKCTSSGHCNHFCPVCQFSVLLRCRRSIFSHDDDQRPCPHSHLSKAKACQLRVDRVRASSLEKSHLARSHNPPPMIPLITAPSSPTPPPHGHITVNQEPHLSDIILPSFPISLFLKSLIII